MASTYGGSENTGPGSNPRLINSVQQKFQALGLFIFNKNEKTVMGRTAKSWGKIGLFYLVYYSCLAAFFVMTMVIFNQTLDQDYPKLQGSDSLLKMNPGLGYRPLPDVSSTLIRFEKGRAETYKAYTNNLETFLKYYEEGAQEGNKLMECRSEKSYRSKSDWDKVCQFDLSLDFGTEKNPCIKQDAFGYDDGLPCILLKLNRIYGWMPEPYINGTDERPSELVDYDENHIKVQCEGENQADQENLQGVTFYPRYGFHFKYFPYLNQEGYRQPLVFAQFNVTNGIVVMVNCKAYAKNIRHNKRELAGSVHFELLVD